MSVRKSWFLGLPLVLVVLAAQVAAHPGRRLQIELVDGQLIAQGVNTGDSDGAPAVREYQNVIHDHWQNSPVIGVESASSAAPEFDIFSPPAELQLRPMELRLLGVTKWVNPPMMPPAGTVPSFSSLGSGELLSLSLGGQSVDSDSLGSLFLSASVPAAGIADIQLTYSVNRRPQGEIYVVETQLANSNPLVQPSDPVFILLSPDGSSPQEKLHHAALYLESYLGTQPVPEPSSLGAALFGIAALGTARRRAHLRCDTV